jgi:hypothetical protein
MAIPAALTAGMRRFHHRMTVIFGTSLWSMSYINNGKFLTRPIKTGLRINTAVRNKCISG